MTSMTEMIDKARSTTITGPAWDIACNMVVVVRGTSGASGGVASGAGVCARSDEALAGARNSRNFSCPDSRYDKLRALSRNQRSAKTTPAKDMARANHRIELGVIAPTIPGI